MPVRLAVPAEESLLRHSRLPKDWRLASGTILEGFGIPSPNANKSDGDADNDMDVDSDDLTIWQNQYGSAAPPLAAAGSMNEESLSASSLILESESIADLESAIDDPIATSSGIVVF